MKKLLLILLCLPLLFSSCKKEGGCTDPTANNYNSSAEEDDGSCAYCTKGVWKVSLAMVNGWIDSTCAASEYYFFNGPNLRIESYNDINSTILMSYSIGTHTPVNSSAININVVVYNPHSSMIASYNLNSRIYFSDGNNFSLTTDNFPSSGDSYYKQLVKTNPPLP